MATPLTESDLLNACKAGLNISQNTTALDVVLKQKILVVKGYLTNAGVSAAVIDTDLSVGVIVLGVTDLWELNGGQAKLSMMFITLASQLAYQSYADQNAFQVTYDGNGNTSGSVPIDTNTYQQADRAIVLANLGGLSRTGYVFSGWNTAANGSGTAYGDGGVMDIGSSDVMLYAKWVAS